MVKVTMLSDGTTYTGRYKTGDELDLNAGVANALVDSGKAEYIAAPKQQEGKESVPQTKMAEEKASSEETNATTETKEPEQHVRVRPKPPRSE